MRSIRLSLIVYFLVLLALALGAVSGLVYWLTSQTVEARKQTTRNLLQAQFEDRSREERAKVDGVLLIQARALAGLVQSQSLRDRFRYQTLLPLGMLSAALNPNGHLLMPVWLAEGVRSPLAYRVHRMAATELQFVEDDLPHFVDGSVTQYFQINGEWGNSWRSPSMGHDAFPFDANMFPRTQPFDWKFDDTELRPGVPVRRVTLKAPVSRFRVYFPPGLRPDPGHRPPRSQPAGSEQLPAGFRPPQERFLEGSAPTFFIQCACDTERRDAMLANLREERDHSLAQLEEESRDTLATLRNRLLLISLATFAATVLGGFWLVRLGLSPLRRLSDAVSRVSEKDFRLQFDEPYLPGELRPIVERLTQTLELLQRAFTREKQAAADISHELRTPLAALLTTTEVALRKPRDSAEYRELLMDCRSLGEQMSQLVERLLALARLDAGVDTLRRQDVDVTALSEQCAALVRPLAQARDLTLQVDCASPVHLTADPDKLREVITNLLHNAIEYNRPQGSVALAVQRQNGHLQVEVRDTGIGIAPEARAHIFERFYRADPSREAVGLHAGLGLAIVKGYVDLMGGTIAVDSVEGQGSTFRVQLPA